ncbi:MucR family transcriptional regulator [Sphingobium sp. Sx8-8]|uniref:MucR family transcriptional regulator n=1 Tax=Sphingobium sp. Sx8-8 TaxID=2933617 RepID=UPI001F57AF96|nr:MucR family transcriptional regulator [Sphingobium sp. Sx8-8]
MSNTENEKESLVSLTANIVSANVSNSPVGVTDLCDMIKSVHSALSSLATHEESVGELQTKREPAVPIRSSIKPEYIVCLEDGKKLKTLKRYLRARYQMSPEEYRAKWGLPPDYPMAAPSYTNQRREMAHKIGLGLRPKAAGKRAVSKAEMEVEEDVSGNIAKVPSRRRGASN